MLHALIFFLAIISVASLTSSLLLWFVLAPRALSALIDSKKERVLIPADVLSQMAGKEEYQISSDNLEDPESIGTKKKRYVPSYEEFDL